MPSVSLDPVSARRSGRRFSVRPRGHRRLLQAAPQARPCGCDLRNSRRRAWPSAPAGHTGVASGLGLTSLASFGSRRLRA